MQQQQQQGQQEQLHRQRMQYILNYELEEHEQVLWSDQPDPWRVFRENSAILFIAIPWVIIVLLWLILMFWLLIASHQLTAPYRFIFALIDLGFPSLLLLLGLFLLDIPFRARRAAPSTPSPANESSSSSRAGNAPSSPPPSSATSSASNTATKRATSSSAPRTISASPRSYLCSTRSSLLLTAKSDIVKQTRKTR
jgi:hypothetical protein